MALSYDGPGQFVQTALGFGLNHHEREKYGTAAIYTALLSNQRRALLLAPEFHCPRKAPTQLESAQIVLLATRG